MRTLLILCLLVVISLPITAQRGANAEERATRMTQMMTDSLNLQAEQIEPVRLANTKFAAATEQMRREFREQRSGSNPPDRGAIRTQMQALEKEYLKSLKPILTDAQYRQYWQIRQRQRETRRQQNGNRRGRRGQ